MFLPEEESATIADFRKRPRVFEPGEVAEWSNVPDSKSGVPQGTVGSNPTLSAKQHSKELQ